MVRALVITYYWPPAGGPGVQRWLKFVKYFRDFGVEPIVYIPQNPHYPLVDNDLVDEIPSDIEILKHPIQEPYGLANFLSRKKTQKMSSGIIPKRKTGFIEKLMLYIRGNFFIPDARVGWVKPSVGFLSKYIERHPIDVLISTGPPHSLHFIGMQLKERLGIKWIADFRDPWTTIHYHKSLRLTKSSAKKHKRMEAAVLNAADTIVVTSPTIKQEFEAITPVPVKVVTNGYDESENFRTTMDKGFSIAHIGSLLSERNPKILWKVLSEISNESDSFSKDLHIKFAGAVSEEVKDSLKEYGLYSRATFLGYISHPKALRLQRESQVLLLVEIDSTETRSIIPGKLFEYLNAKRPIIALGPKKSDIKTIIRETESGKFFDYTNADHLKKQILSYYDGYRRNDLHINSKGIEGYSRRELTRKMAKIIIDQDS